MKWNAYHIVEFLNIYERYPLLWNIKHKNYCNIKLKDKFFKQLYSELDEKQLLGGVDVKRLKAKIKSIKDVYRQELKKIEKSKKSGCGSEDVYSPKLAWFNAASYLAGVLSTRSTKSDLHLSQNIPKTEPYECSDGCRESIETINDNSWSEEQFENKSHVKMRPPAPPTKRLKERAASEQPPSEIPATIQKLDKSAQNEAEGKPYDQFGKFVAAELRHLPQRQAILLQQEIQNSIIRYKLASLEPAVSPNTQTFAEVSMSGSDIHSPDSQSLSSIDDDNDPLQEFS